MEFEIVWNGTLDRQGLAPHATGYIGRSSLFICDTRAPKEVAPLMLHDDEQRIANSKKYRHSDKGQQIERERQQRRAANKRWRDRHKPQIAAYFRQWKAAQQDLFSA